MRQRLGAALLLGATTLGCSTQYTPRAPGRVSIVIENGGMAYHRDGRVVPVGMFGSGLVEIVGDDPEARALAESAESKATTGFVATLAGAVCLIGGVAYGLSDLESGDTVAVGLGGGLLCYLAGVIVGTSMLMDAQRDTFDAINVFNDHQDLRLRPMWRPGPGVPYPYAPGAAPPAAALPPASFVAPAPPAGASGAPPAAMPPSPPAPPAP